MREVHKWLENEDAVIIRAVNDNLPAKEVAELLNLDVAKVYKRIRDLRKEGKLPLFERKVWNPKWDDALLKTVANNPGNLSACFRKFAEKYEVSYYTVRNRYYKDLKNAKPVFFLGGIRKAGLNVKNGDLPIKHNIWQKLKNLFN